MSRSVLIMVAPNGARRTGADHPALPVTATEIAAAAEACADAGAAALHLHVRTRDGAHTLDAGRYAEALAAAAARCGDRLAIQVTSEAVGQYTPREQIAAIDRVRPGAVSVALRELVPDDAGEPVARAFFERLKRHGTSPQFILYEPDEVDRFFTLKDRGTIPFARPFLLFVLGRYAADGQSMPADLDPFVARLAGRDVPWMMCAFGMRENDCVGHAISLGGHVRVGFENNLYLPDGTLASSNADLVALAAQAVTASGDRVMDAAGARDLFAASAR